MADHYESKEVLEQRLKEKLYSNFSAQEEVLEYLVFTLNNFSYRYLESEGTGELVVELEEEGIPSLTVKAIEPNLAQALKTAHRPTKDGIISMAKSFKKSDGAKVQYTLRIELKDLAPHSEVVIKASAIVDWGFPLYDQEDKRISEVKELSYSDVLDMRNNFPRHFDDICAIF